MKIKNIHNKSYIDLKKELLHLLREQFNLKMQIKSNQLKKTHLLKETRKNIARIKTLITRKVNLK
ncbi:MAG: 50S ribosomal protein L29 [Enterobacterales bacterium]